MQVVSLYAKQEKLFLMVDWKEVEKSYSPRKEAALLSGGTAAVPLYHY